MKGGFKKEMDFKKMSKRAQTGGLITSLIFGVASLIIGVIIAYVIITTLTGAGLVTGGEATAVTSLSQNFTTGVNHVSSKIPTVLLVAAIVLILGVLAILVGVWQRMRMGGGTTL